MVAAENTVIHVLPNIVALHNPGVVTTMLRNHRQKPFEIALLEYVFKNARSLVVHAAFTKALTSLEEKILVVRESYAIM